MNREEHPMVLWMFIMIALTLYAYAVVLLWYGDAPLTTFALVALATGVIVLASNL